MSPSIFRILLFIRATAGLLSPIATDNPGSGIAGGTVECDSPPVSSFFNGTSTPYMTNGWWAPFAAPPGDATAAGPFPYESQLQSTGVVFGVSNKRDFDGVSIHQWTQRDWQACFSEHSGNFANHKATTWDTQSVTVEYFQGSSSMAWYAVPGSPYVTFKYEAATPLLTSLNGNIVSFNGKALKNGENATETGTIFTVTDSAGSNYIIYGLSSLTLTATYDSSTIKAASQFSGVLRMAMMNETSHKALLDEHYQVYPTTTELDYSFTDTTSTLSFHWDTVGNGADLLMLTWPHHRASIQNPNYPPTTALSYLTTKGYMYPILGNEWQLLYDLPNITWNAPRGVDSSCLSTLIQGLEYEVGQLVPSNAPIPGDFYYWGGSLNAVARLAVIADEVGRPDLIPVVTDYLKTSFAYWFNTSATTLAAYETTWGGVVNKAGATNAWVDFGNGYYNDHHFHYGYFLAVAATIARYDGDWLNTHRDYINWFARDIINASPDDPYFPITRCRDWFAGHSWASGIANGAGSRDQESTGEAVNGYYGALLWASVTLSQDYVNYARLLLATEIQGAKTYWHMYPSYSASDPLNPYPEQGLRELITIGNVEDWQAGAWLFWGNQKVQIAAIQQLPVTPISEVLYDTEWVENMWAYTMDELLNSTYTDDWKSVIVAAYSNAKPHVAAEWSANMTDWGSGLTYSEELYFISSRVNPSGVPICQNMPSNPYGSFYLRDYATGLFVTASAANTNLAATLSSASGAAIFNSSYVPNSGTLQLESSSQYVTADSSGNYALSATRATASSWERFIIRQKIGAPDGVYSILANSNSMYVTVSSEGLLINNAADEASSAGFYFTVV